MAYTNEEKERYLGILNNFDHQEFDNRFTCCNCQSENFFIEAGYYICESCGTSNGYVLGYYDLREYDRFYYRRKSIYQRKYHYENKVKDISMRLCLNDEEEQCFF